MGRRKKTEENDPQETGAETLAGTGPTPERAEAGFTTRNVDDGGKRKPRVSFNVTEDGKVDWDSVRDKSKLKEQFVLIAGDPEVLKALGIGTAVGGEWTEDNIKFGLNASLSVMGTLGKVIAKRIAKIDLDNETLGECYTWSEEQLKELVPRGTRLANKYSTDGMKKYQDEIAFAVMFFEYSRQQLFAAIALQMEKNRAAERESNAKAKTAVA